MKIPKKIKIGGFDWTIVNEKRGGGWFETVPRKIGVCLGEKDTMQILLHEIMEILLVQNYNRFEPIQGDNYLFSFNHIEFSKVIKDLYQVIKDNNLKF